MIGMHKLDMGRLEISQIIKFLHNPVYHQFNNSVPKLVFEIMICRLSFTYCKNYKQYTSVKVVHLDHFFFDAPKIHQP